MWCVSLSRTGMVLSLVRNTPTKQLHAPLNVQGGADAGQGQSELDESNRHSRTHADDDGFGIDSRAGEGTAVSVVKWKR